MSTVLTAPSVRKKKSFVKPQPSVRMRVWDEMSSISMAAPEMCWPKPMRAIGAQNLLTMPGGVSISGYLHKKGGSQFSLLKWPLRYVILHKGCVYYFKSSTSACPQGAFSLNGYNRVIRAAEETTSSNVFPFKIVHFSKKHRTWLFSAASEDERRKWMRGLRKEIDYYNDRRDSHIPSDDSDGESFYGTIERLMEIKTPADNAEEDYTDEDDENDEDYLTPDSDCSPTSSIGRPMAPPPTYPPPPVPAPALALALALAPARHGVHTPSPSCKKPPTPPSALPRDNGPPPPLPNAPHLHKSTSLSQPPPPPPPVPKHRRVTMQPEPGTGTAGSTKEARTLPPLASMAICDPPRNRAFPGAAPYSSVGVEVTHSLGNSRPSFTVGPPPLPPPNATPPTKPMAVSPKCGRMDPQGRIRPAPLCQPSLSQPLLPPQPVAQPRPVPDRKPPLPKPPLPSAKPNRHGGSALERPSPDGRSFRNSVDEVPDDCKKRRDKRNKSGGDSDDDYENIHLPDSVYIDTTETIFVERLFKEGSIPPHNGLYGIRNSGTKTSKVLVVWDVSYGKARNYRVFEEEKSMYLERDLNFPSLAALIEHYHSHPLPQHNSLVLQRPYGYILPR